jgi:hypothetical protein
MRNHVQYVLPPSIPSVEVLATQQAMLRAQMPVSLKLIMNLKAQQLVTSCSLFLKLNPVFGYVLTAIAMHIFKEKPCFLP